MGIIKPTVRAMAHVIETVLGLMVAVATVAVLARRLQVPYPILLVIGGFGLALIPGLPRVRLNPDWVFLFFLPPLLYPAALFTSWRDFRADLPSISLLAVGLVLFTTVVIAWVAHALTGMSWAAGFVLGAIVSPPDALAATQIAHRGHANLQRGLFQAQRHGKVLRRRLQRQGQRVIAQRSQDAAHPRAVDFQSDQAHCASRSDKVPAIAPGGVPSRPCSSPNAGVSPRDSGS